jgi:(p)ppGpp synthase/HD superfamily hydrolase
MLKLQAARQFAQHAHGDQKYGGGAFPYAVHLMAVECTLRGFSVTDEDMLCGAWLHDTLEDTDAKAADIHDLFGPRVLAMVLDVTEPPIVDGVKPNRKTRHAHTYPRIAANPDAVLLKLADRIANVEFGGKVGMYQKEHSGFQAALYDTPGLSIAGFSMQVHLNSLLA